MPPARRHLRELVTWWKENRPAARNQVTREFARVSRLLAKHPHIGQLYEDLEGIRTCRLQKTPYDIFYEVREALGEVHIVAVWSRMREHGPQLG